MKWLASAMLISSPALINLVLCLSYMAHMCLFACDPEHMQVVSRHLSSHVTPFPGGYLWGALPDADFVVKGVISDSK